MPATVAMMRSKIRASRSDTHMSESIGWACPPWGSANAATRTTAAVAATESQVRAKRARAPKRTPKSNTRQAALPVMASGASAMAEDIRQTMVPVIAAPRAWRHH